MFHFTLQEILNYRSAMRDKAQASLGEAIQAEKAITDEITSLNNNVKNRMKLLKGSTNLSDLTRLSDYRNFAAAKIITLNEQLLEAKKVTDTRRSALKKAQQQLDSLKKVRDSQYEEYKIAEQRAADNVLDDLITSRTPTIKK